MAERKLTKEVRVGNIAIGGNNRIAIQSMTCTKTKDITATLNQISALQKAGCDIIRVAVLDFEDANSLYDIVRESQLPIVADIHFDYKLALIAIDAGVAKLRINPGNIGNIEGIKQIVIKCQEKNIPIRIGVNSGSINKDIYNLYGDSAIALVKSAEEHLKILEDLGFYNIVVSIKASSVLKTIEAYTLFSQKYNYPLHLGVTEAGTSYAGSIKSSIAIGHLLLNGIGDTIRVSLTADPVEEVFAAKEILASIEMFEKPVFVSCPTCGRCQYNMMPIAKEISEFLKTKTGKIKVAVMGCAVNGPGEAKDADIGIAGGKSCALLFKKGQIIKKIPESEITNTLKNEIVMLLDGITYKYCDSINEEIISLRTDVFCNEQGFKEEFDTIDSISKYVIIYKNNMAIGTGRIYKDSTNYHIGRICITKDNRNNRYGSIILMLLENIIKENSDISDTTFILSSQDHAVNFYKKNGYIDINESYYEEFCLHYKLKKEYKKITY